ncbi:MAG: hypothetical protein WD793_01900 [Steroidobacteraceae bacterium]
MFAAACLGLIAYKLFLVGRININWDEFLYLNVVHAHARDAMTQLFQGAHAHLFLWLTGLSGDEIDQIRAARLVMVGLLALTGGLVWLLGRRWLGGFAAWVPPFVYLSALPVLQHGGSFRVDSLLAPLLVAALLCCTRRGPLRGRDWYAGVLLGVAFALSLKTVLFLPMVVLALALRKRTDDARPAGQLRAASIASGRMLLAAFTGALLLLLLHSLAIAAPPADTLEAYGARVAGKTLLDVPMFSRADELAHYFKWQPLPWLLIAVGAAAALMQRRWQAATLVLALLPIAFYRNAFPYFYVVMLAPAAILAGLAVQQLSALLRTRVSAGLLAALVGLIAAGLLYQAKSPARRVWEPQQASQRALLSAVHRIFPDPVDYIDCCGMVSSFRKRNFFMSTWGMEDYRARGAPFMSRVMQAAQPEFVLVNTPHLDPERKLLAGLLAEDLDRIRNFYPVYWGPIRVAGAEGRLTTGQPLELTVPFEGRYRLATESPVRIAGRLHQDGDVIRFAAGALRLVVEATGDTAAGSHIALYIASARRAPDSPPAAGPLFVPL